MTCENAISYTAMSIAMSRPSEILLIFTSGAFEVRPCHGTYSQDRIESVTIYYLFPEVNSGK